MSAFANIFRLYSLPIPAMLAVKGESAHGSHSPAVPLCRDSEGYKNYPAWP